MKLNKIIVTLLSSFPLLTACTERSKPQVTPAGKEESAKTTALEAGAQVLQRDSPVDRLGIYLVGLHPHKENPGHQMEAHHFCNQVNEDFAQCALFDGNTKDANLNGIEYIISEKLFETLPEEEKKYWHPHNYEIFSGQLIAPGIPVAAEKELMKQKVNSYGKTWHLWNTGDHAGMPADKLPLGEPKLAWSFNRDGEAKPDVLNSMREKFNVNSEEKKEQRQEFLPLARPQKGVDALKDKFSGPTQPIPGVEDADAVQKRP